MRTLVDKYIPMINSANTEFELEVVGEESTTSETVMTKEQTTAI